MPRYNLDRRFLLVAVLVGLLFPVPARAQPTKGKKYALLVGVAEYRHDSLINLKGTENDVEELAKVLLSPACGFTSVRLLTTTRGKKKAADAPTADNIHKELEALREGKTKDDTVLIALSGHGGEVEVPDPEGEKKANTYVYFFPADADFEKISHSTGKAKRLVNLSDLFDRLGLCGARTKLVLIDACRDELKATSSTRARAMQPSDIRVPDGVGALFSCRSGQRAYEMGFERGKERIIHGVFFYHVLEGLKGKAKNLDGTVNWYDLTSYLQRRVPDYVKEKTGIANQQDPHAMNNPKDQALLVLQTDAAERRARDEVVKPEVLPDEKKVTNRLRMKLILLPVGRFKMGSSPGESNSGDDGEVREVELTKAFYVSAHEVTQRQFRHVMGYNPSFFSRDAVGKKATTYYAESKPGGGKDKVAGSTDDFPVDNVSWDEAVEFCAKLSALTGRKYRLPTEAEWEYACRGGAPVRSVFHFGNALSSKLANFDGNQPHGGAVKGVSLGRTAPVGSYKPNGFGLHDMHGNVWEWCSDWYDPDYPRFAAERDPQGPPRPLSLRVKRGGSWADEANRCRSALRIGETPGYRFHYLGFRVVLETARK